MFNKDEMVFLDVLYVALATIGIMILLQVSTFFIARMMHPPEPRIIYRDAPVQMPPPPPQMQAQVYIPPQTTSALTQPPMQEVKLPEYEPRQSTSSSLRMDPELPPGIQETRPDGT
jgi:hypothetical protein